jgi:hypothetical protein
LCAAAGIADASISSMMSAPTQAQIADFLLGKTRKALDKLATERDIPLFTLCK